MHAYKKKDANPQKGIDSQGISIEKTGYCRGNFSLTKPEKVLIDVRNSRASNATILDFYGADIGECVVSGCKS